MSAAAAAPAAVASALQLTPEIIAVHEVIIISSSTMYHQTELSLFFLSFQSRCKTSHRPACVNTGRPLEHGEIIFKY
jgi:hypothetical protein